MPERIDVLHWHGETYDLPPGCVHLAVALGRHLYDFTFSAPKSVSIMAILGGDQRLLAAHEKAVAEAVEELESCAASRVRQNFANGDRMTFVCFPVEHGATCTTLKIRAETLLLTSRNTAYTIDDVDVMHSLRPQLE